MRNALELWNRNNGWLEDILEPMSAFKGVRPSFSPAMDLEETDSHYLFSFDLPGMSEKDVRIEWNDGQLTVSGERRTEKKDSKSRHLIERSYGSFVRSFTLPSTVDSDRIQADFRNGVLEVSVPKVEAARPKQITIGRSDASKKAS